MKGRRCVFLLFLARRTASSFHLSSSSPAVIHSEIRLWNNPINNEQRSDGSGETTSIVDIDSHCNGISSSLPFQQQEQQNQAPIGLYVHIPYCRRRCRYCNFAITPIGQHAITDINSATTQDDVADRATRGFLDMDDQYLKAMLKELRLIFQSSQNKESQQSVSIALSSIYFGGGTPSLAPIETLRRILDFILNHGQSPFHVEENAEISIEMDPGTFSLEKLQALKQIGFNRISLGVQSFDDNILSAIGRVHRRDDIFHSLAMIQEVYGDSPNYSLDLISGLPGLTLAKWTESLECATNLTPKPTHLSLYDLQIEQGTVFDKWYKNVGYDRVDSNAHLFSSSPSNNDVPKTFLPSAEECAFMYSYAAGYLKSKGYEHYEISSYAFRPDESTPSQYRSRHNQVYWTVGGQWYAIGLGSTSSIGGKLVARPKAMRDYIDWADHQELLGVSETTGQPCRNDGETNSNELEHERLTDIIMTRLRTLDGLDLDWIQNYYMDGDALVNTILNGAGLGLELGLVERFRSPTGANTIRLVDPKGFLYSNTIISGIFLELEGFKVKCRQ